MKKRIFSFCLLVVMLLSFMSSICITASATLVVAQDAKFVDQSWSETSTPASITFSGQSFALTWGTNAYADAQTALDAAKEGGTVVLRAGTYDSALYVKKDLTILGEKAGIDPNVRGTNATDDWTLSTQRGTDETMITNIVYLGVAEKTVYDTDFTCTVDGIMLTAGGQLRSNSGTAGKGTLTIKNIYIKDNTTSTGAIYLMPVHFTGDGNLYQRNVTITNVRYENQSYDAMVLTADSADISGVYVDKNSTCVFLPNASASAASTAAVNWNIHNSMFRNKVGRTMYFNWDSTQVSVSQTEDDKSTTKVYLNATLENRAKVTTTVSDCVFYDCFVTTGANNNYTLAFRPDQENVYYVFEDNIFCQTSKPASGHNAITGYAKTTLSYGDQISVKNNKFIGVFSSHWSFNNSGNYVDISGNYYENETGEVLPLITKSILHKQSWWWGDSDMTQKVYAEQPEPTANSPKLDLDKDVKWLGRNYVDGGKHYFSWSNSGFEFNFYGTAAYATMDFTNNYGITSESHWKSETAYLWVYVDGVKSHVLQITEDTENVCLVEGLTEGTHSIKVVKRVNGRSNKVGLSRIWLNEGASIDLPNVVAGRKIQFIGDSITVGYGDIQPISESTWTVNTEDSTVTYAARTAEYFGAENHTVAISGRGVLWNTGDEKDTANHAPLMYNYTDWSFKGNVQWDHTLYQPDVVVINLGTNDNSKCKTAADKAEFQAAVKAFIQQVRGVNPNAHIIWAFGAMGDANGIQTNIEAAIAELTTAGDTKIYYVPLTENNKEENLSHPTAAGHEALAEPVIAKVAEVTGWDQHTSHNHSSSVYKAATCKADGIMKYTCEACGDVYTETIVSTGTEHNFDNDCDTDCSECTFTRVTEHDYDDVCDDICNVCYAPRTAPHSYDDDACDAICNLCGAPRTNAHKYQNACDPDCDLCGAPRTIQHTYDNACDVECNICHAIRVVGEHRYDNACDTACNICSKTRTVGGHKYDNACDTVCNECGATRTIQHTYNNACDTDCNVCGKTRTIQHTPSSWQVVTQVSYLKDGLEKQYCTVCGTELDSRIVPTLQGTDVAKVFSDIKTTDWFYKNDAIYYVYNAGLFKGITQTEFKPSTAMNRAMFVTVLGRLHGVNADSITYKNTFSDVANGKYYSKYVIWAADNGIVTGTSATGFAPDNNITREQICTMMVRYCNYAGIKLRQVNAAINFSDAGSIANYAKTAVATCQTAGLVSGKGDNKFDPKGNAKRSEVATILLNFAKNYL